MVQRMIHSASRWSRWPFFWVLAFMFLVALVANTNHRSNLAGNRLWAGDRPSLSDMNQKTLQREGTPLTEIKGRFITSNKERTSFIEDESKRSYKCLENQMLQRVESSLTTDGKLVWIVTGKVTEYSNENFLLVEKAVRTR